MRRLLLTPVLLLAAACAQPTVAEAPPPTPELTLEDYFLLSEGERRLYVAGLADALDAAAAMTKNQRLTLIATCTNGFEAEALRQAVEAGPPDIQIKWAADTPAANWFTHTMTLVCQLQLPPE